MRKLHFTLIIALSIFLFTGCATNYKAQIGALGQFNYDVASVDQVRIAGRDISSFDANSSSSLASLPGIAFALLRQDLPLQGRVNLKITNPTKTLADINEFKYVVELGGKPIFEGSVDQNIKLSTGQSMVLPLSFSANIFGVAKEQGIDRVLNDIFTKKGNGFFVLKIKPSVKIGGRNYFYPGYITVDKDLAKTIGKAASTIYN